jgi:CheY-like chemotaxis protein
MKGLDRATWFAGDLSDPWVVEIAEALPRDSLRLDCPDDLPEFWPIDRPSPFALVLHRSKLTPTDAQRVARLRSRADRTPRVVLCVSPHARYVDVERWSRLVDAVIPEAIARDTVLRQAHLLDLKDRSETTNRAKVAIASANHEIRSMLTEAARSGGFNVEAALDPSDTPQTMTLAWDIPVLEPDWPSRLASLARTRPVIALIGFADRQNVTIARQAGAFACLDMPCEVADLVAILDQASTIRLDPAHDLPPMPSVRRASSIRKH